ncbi:DEAD/DEAH box helicase [Pseudoscardovia radai]|uniref:DEAD/DEAH box helicase n=1 Tax=Pseudoscardovia radai TaxID=987066 RepID=UPI0039955ECD
MSAFQSSNNSASSRRASNRGDRHRPNRGGNRGNGDKGRTHNAPRGSHASNHTPNYDIMPEEPQAAEFSADEISHDADRADLTFEQLGVPGRLVNVLADDGKIVAFPIQADTLPDSLNGRDVLGRGRTGSGKTLAFTIPLVARLGEGGTGASAMREFKRLREREHEPGAERLPHPRGMVLAPTRELVNQIDDVIKPLARAYGMSTVTIYGGVNQKRQVARLKAGADIIVACPGRLEDLLGQKLLSLAAVEVSVLDEADEMADMGFLPAVTRLLGQTDPNGQRMLFSATLDHGVDKVVEEFLQDAKVHAVADSDEPVDTMTHHLFSVSRGNKYEVIRALASGKGKSIFFTRTKFQAQKMAKKLVQQGIPAVDLQGNLSQNQRDRNLSAFTDGLVRVLVATDVAARGIDVSGVKLVVQTEPPQDSKSFQHRSGRTARAGESGDVVTLVLPEQVRYAKSLMRRAGIEVEPQEVVPGSPAIEELVGEPAPTVENWTLAGAREKEQEERKELEHRQKAAARRRARAARREAIARGEEPEASDEGRPQGKRHHKDARFADSASARRRGGGRGNAHHGRERDPRYREDRWSDDGPFIATERDNGRSGNRFDSKRSANRTNGRANDRSAGKRGRVKRTENPFEYQERRQGRRDDRHAGGYHGGNGGKGGNRRFASSGHFSQRGGRRYGSR